jgi:hypothetical protein
VLRARFASGCEVVYKRILAVDVHFQQLLAWLNDRGAAGIPTLAIVDRPITMGRVRAPDQLHLDGRVKPALSAAWRTWPCWRGRPTTTRT